MQAMRSTSRHGDDESAPSVLSRAMAILAAFDGERRSLGTSELARRTGLAKSTVHRLAGELIQHGLLERRSDGFMLGLRLFELGQRVPRQLDLRTAALPYMADLRAATRQTVHLAVLDGTDVVYVEILRSHDAPPLPSRIGGRLPAHATAVGKAILAFSGSDVIDRVLHAELLRLAERTVTAANLLQRNLKLVRANGIAYDYEESQAGLVCAASPITGADRAIVGALSVSGWAGLLNVRRIGPAIRTAALALSRDLSPTSR
jgi:IclR family acetate operon transcriptional repressor